MAASKLKVCDPHTSETRCCFCGRSGSLWAGYDQIGQWNCTHWPVGWRYNHGNYGYGPGNGEGCMCPEC